MRDDTDVPIKRIEVSVYTVPTDTPESDGTLEWESTTLVLVTAFAGDCLGLGYTYADNSTGVLIQNLLAKIVEGRHYLFCGPRPCRSIFYGAVSEKNKAPPI